MTVHSWLYRRLGEGNETPNPPGSSAELDFGDPDDDGKPMLVARTYCNDGFELWVGYRSRWLFHCEAKHARRLAWFILWEWWAKSTWFGMKRWLWYRALHRVVSQGRGVQ